MIDGMTAFDGLPFTFIAGLPVPGESAALELCLEAGDGNGGDGPLLLACDEVVRLFALCVEDRLFGAAPGTAGPSQFKLLESASARGGAFHRYRFRMEAVPPHAFLSLLAMLAQNAYSGDPLGRVVLRPLPPSEAALDAAALLDSRCVMADRRHRPLPFHLAGSIGYGRQRTITYEFEQPLSGQDAEDVVEALNRWDHIRVLGGFQLDFREIDTPDFGEMAHIAPGTVECRISDSGHGEFNEFALDALVNFGASLCARGLVLSEMLIE